MNTLTKYIIRSYIGPFVLTFFISVFILFMQFLWKYVDDLIGKGLDISVLAQLFFFASLSTVPLALPLSILLSSIMTFGNLGEHYELVALKSSGLSLQKIMRPLIVFSFLLSIFAFYFSNTILPYANLKMGSLLFDVTNKKPALSIKEGVFYTGIDGYVIRVNKKHEDGKMLDGIMIYDHTRGGGNSKVMIAESGKMEMSSDSRFLILTLKNGQSYDEMLNPEQGAEHPLMRNKFKEQLIRLDLSGFKLKRTDEGLFKSSYQMLNISQINAEMDSIHHAEKQEDENFMKRMMENNSMKEKTRVQRADTSKQVQLATNGFLDNNQLHILEMATNSARNTKSLIESHIEQLEYYDDPLVNLLVERHKKFTLSFACLVLFFVGAPLGAIIRKGGLGMPVVVSVLFFIFFWVISITGEKSAKEGVLPPVVGMWLASAVILPIGIFLTLQATKDSSLFDVNSYLEPFRKIFGRKNK